MARDYIKSRASFKSGIGTGKQESMERGRTGVPWPSSYDTDLESSEVVHRGESGLMRMEGAWSDSGPSGETIPSVSPVLSSMAAESLACSKLPSSDSTKSSGSEAKAAVEATNPWKIKSPRISACSLGF